MDEQELLHRISVKADVNIELLKDLFHDDKFLALIKSGNKVQAIGVIRSTQPAVGLREAKMIVDMFAEEVR